MDLPTAEEIAGANAALDEIASECGAWIAQQRQFLAKGAELSGKFLKVESVTTRIAAAKEPAASVAEGAPVDPSSDHTLDDFHGQSVPRSARITMHTETNWTGELGESVFQGDPASVAASLRQAAADAASFLKS